LPPDLREQADDAIGTFSYRARTRAGRREKDNHDPERIARTPDTRHRLVNRNPVNGRKSLYIDPRTVTGVDGMSRHDALALLDELERRATAPENVYTHHWEVGDLVLWDNAVLLHRRDGFPNEQHRLMKRMIIDLPDEEHATPDAVPAEASPGSVRPL